MSSHVSKASNETAAVTPVSGDSDIHDGVVVNNRIARSGGADYRVLILGGDSDYNLGDHAILHALCDSLSRADSRVRITITSSRHHRDRFPGVVRVIPRGGRCLPALMESAKQQDLIIVGGGGLFQDDDSRIKMPYWGGRLKLLSRLNPRMAGHSLGAGPLRHQESRWFARMACNSLQSISVRDEFARDWLAPCTERPVSIAPDPAFMLKAAPTSEAEAYLSCIGVCPDKPVIGVSLRRWFHPRGGFIPQKFRSRIAIDRDHGAREMEVYLQQVASALQVLAEEHGASILLMPTYNTPHEADARVCARLAELMPGTDTRLACIDDPCLYKAVCGRLTLMISSRMHPLILAAGVGVPGVGLGYNGKFSGFFKMLGGPKRLMGLNEFGQADQVDRLLSLARSTLEDRAGLLHKAEMISQQAHLRTVQLLSAFPHMARSAT